MVTCAILASITFELHMYHVLRDLHYDVNYSSVDYLDYRYTYASSEFPT